MTRRAAPPPTAGRVVVLGVDASWGGLGWTLGDARGPLVWGHAKAPPAGDTGRRFRWFWDELVPVWDTVIADASFGILSPTDPPVRVAVERPPQAHDRGNQATTAYAMGLIVGAVLTWATRPGAPTLTPWDVPTTDERSRRGAHVGDVLRYGWRPWWGLQKVAPVGRHVPPDKRDEARRQLRKQAAIRLAVSLPGARDLYGPKTLSEALDDWNGPSGDVAESVLISVGCARNAALAPKDRNG